MRIKLDIDEKIDLVEFFKQKKLIISTLECKVKCIFVAETVKGYHVILDVQSPYLKTEEDRIFFQLLFGSDPVREALNWRRLRVLNTPINVLFNRKEKFRPELVKKLNETFREIEKLIYTEQQDS